MLVYKFTMLNDTIMKSSWLLGCCSVLKTSISDAERKLGGIARYGKKKSNPQISHVDHRVWPKVREIINELFAHVKISYTAILLDEIGVRETGPGR